MPQRQADWQTCKPEGGKNPILSTSVHHLTLSSVLRLLRRFSPLTVGLFAPRAALDGWFAPVRWHGPDLPPRTLLDDPGSQTVDPSRSTRLAVRPW